MKKSDAEIVAVYEEALKRVTKTDDIMSSYAVYLEDTGNYKDALKYYEILLKNYPNNQTYKEEVANLKLKVK